MTRWAEWLGINRATMAVLVVVGGLGLSEELWRNVHTGDVVRAVGFMCATLGFALPLTNQGLP